jgi:hypothetical protein
MVRSGKGVGTHRGLRFDRSEIQVVPSILKLAPALSALTNDTHASKPDTDTFWSSSLLLTAGGTS